MKKNIEFRNATTIWELTKRNITLYFKDKLNVFFSVLAPLIILILYILFLKDLQIQQLLSSIPEGVEIDQKLLIAVVDSWMVSGILSVSCLTVALNSTIIRIADRQNKIFMDFKASPVKSFNLTLSYFLSFVIITVIVCFIVYLCGILYLVISGSMLMSAAAIFESLGILLLSILSAVCVMMFIMGFRKISLSASTSIAGIFSAIIGFLIGAYMPISVFPIPVQYVANFLPGSHSAALFRNTLMGGAIEKLMATAPPEFVETITSTYSLNLNFFGVDMNMLSMYLYLAGSIVVFLLINILIDRLQKRKAD